MHLLPDGMKFCGGACDMGYKLDAKDDMCKPCLEGCERCVYDRDYWMVVGSGTCHTGKCPDSTTVKDNTTSSKTCTKDTVL